MSIKSNKSNKIIYIGAVFLFVLMINTSFGQAIPPPPPPPIPGVPFGPVEFLIAGLAAYGAKKMYKKK